MIQVFKTDEDYKKWLNGQTLPSGIVVYVSDDETMYFSTNNIKGELKTYKCEKDEPIQYPPLIYSTNAAGSTITVNGQSVTLEQGDNITLDYPNEITSVEATGNVELTYLQIPNTVTSINDNAFGDCDALSSIILPDSVKSIGVQAFQACIGLTSINIPSGVTSISMETFNACSALASVTLPEGLTNIGSSTFMDCTSLTSITIPSTVTMIDFEAFNYCEALTDFNFNGTMEQWGAITLGDDWNLNAAFTVVHCTDGDVSLEEVIQYPPLVYSTNAAGSTITVNGETVTLEQGDNITLDYPNEITSVKATNNTALTYIQIPNTVVSINDNAFTGCTELTDFRYNGTVEEWGAITLGTDWNKDAAFTVVHCTDGDVSLEEPIQPIPPSALVYSTNAAGSTITVNGQSMTLEQGDNITLEYPTEITSVKATKNTALTAITIPNTVTSLESHAFYECEKLTSITLPDTMTSIGQQTFEYCTSLVSITLPEGLTKISGYLFNNCTSLTSVTLPEGLTKIYNNAFSNCEKLTSITLPEGLTEIYDYAFQRCINLTDFNYNGTVEQWASITKSYYWKSVAAFTVVHCSDGDVTL